ncbi:MAG: hypothetical protein MI863_09755 [Desulfobacterales bacterium]|nr:hypothetical protein [Desulfobacterales bacterium]
MTMTENEKEVLHAYLNSAVHYLEFGSGESTVYAAGVDTIQRIDSVESSIDFVESHLSPLPVIQSALASGKLGFHFVDIGPTGKWGYPASNRKKHLWPSYSLSIFSKKSEHDLVLIDGRFRIASTLNCILNTPQDSKIIIHDFWDRKQYHLLLNYLSVVERTGTLAVFIRKPDLPVKKIQRIIWYYQYIPHDRSIYFKIKQKLIKMLSSGN